MLSRDFVTAGNATFTIEPSAEFVEKTNTPPHYTFRVRFSKPTLDYPATPFVHLLAGPDNTSSYVYVGILNPDTGEVRLTAKSKMTADSWPVLILQKTLKAIWEGRETDIQAAGWKVHHEGRCGRCGRLLTVPASIESGIGPECAKHVA